MQKSFNIIHLLVVLIQGLTRGLVSHSEVHPGAYRDQRQKTTTRPLAVHLFCVCSGSALLGEQAVDRDCVSQCTYTCLLYLKQVNLVC